MSPTFGRDKVDSVTLKSFRKVIGYDTFNSILKKDRDEVKDPKDHYNITVSMMVTRSPEDQSSAPKLDIYGPDQNKRLSQIIDKGFPYDDGDNSIDDQAQLWRKKNGPAPQTLVGKLNGENITKENLKNLVKDTEVPITQALVQTESQVNMGKDSDNVFKLMDANVTKGQMKNLLTDKPAPITVKLAQKDSDNVFKLMDANVTKGQMKNLLTDKPAPITVKLAQKDSDNVFKLMDANVTKGQMKNLLTDKPAPITVKLAQKDSDNVFKLMDANVTKGQMKNLLTDKPAPITVKLAQKGGVPVHVDPVIARPTGVESADLGLNMRVGPDEVKVNKK